jgi:hypothetical protein
MMLETGRPTQGDDQGLVPETFVLQSDTAASEVDGFPSTNVIGRNGSDQQLDL